MQCSEEDCKVIQKCNKIQKGSLLGSSAAGIEILEDDIGKICDMTENVKKTLKTENVQRNNKHK